MLRPEGKFSEHLLTTTGTRDQSRDRDSSHSALGQRAQNIYFGNSCVLFRAKCEVTDQNNMQSINNAHGFPQAEYI